MGTSRATFCVFASYACIMSGCLQSDNGADEGPAPSSPALIPFDHRFELTAALGAGEWIVWLWRNHIEPERRDLTEPYAREIHAHAVDTGSDPFWFGAYWINVALDPANGTARFMSERAPARVQYLTNDYLRSQDSKLLGEEGSSPPRASDFEGILMFSEQPIRLTYMLSRGSGLAMDGPSPVARGMDLAIYGPPLSTHDQFNALEESAVVEATAGGFLAGGRAIDFRPGIHGMTTYDYGLQFPDGEQRLRTFQHTFDEASSDRCFPSPTGPADLSPCRRGYAGSIDMMDYVNSCQPKGHVEATITMGTPNPNVRPLPILFHVPYDYCPLVGADATTPHPCTDMTTEEFRGCPPP